MKRHANIRGGRGERVSDILPDPAVLNWRELDALLPEVYQRQLEKAKTPEERAVILARINANRKASKP